MYGRGGAGNFKAVEKENERISADLEASQSAAELSSREPLPTDYLDREQPQYSHTGRGGAGNFYSTEKLDEARGTADAGVTAGGPVASKPEGQRSLPGRGGAGNYAYGASQDEERAANQRREEEQSREKLKQDIEKGVKESLALPPKAKLPGAEPY